MTAAVLGAELEALAKSHSEWSQATFGTDGERGPVGALLHLAKEAKETEEAWREIGRDGASIDNGVRKMREEFADCLLLLLDSSRRAGLTPESLIREAWAKLEKNRQRAWPKPQPDQPVEHVRD
jgi:NTP pyrophosphatase (non-canonical NTP hydrolase)